MTDSMKAVRLHEFGDTSVLQCEDAPRTPPRAEQVEVRVRAASVNALDWKVRRGVPLPMIPDDPFPLPLGLDLSGVVERVGADISEFTVGDAVFGWSGFPESGAYAEYVTTTPANLTTKPASLYHVEAAAVPAVGATAWHALFEIANLEAGDRVLVHGAAGGVGHMAVQLATWTGASVVGTASGSNERFLRYLGVDEFVNYRNERFEDAVADVDVVLDTVGGDTLARSFDVLLEGGVIVSTADTPDRSRAAAANVTATRVGRADPGLLANLADLIDTGEIRPVVSTQLPFSKAAVAHGESEERHARGKIVLRV